MQTNRIHDTYREGKEKATDRVIALQYYPLWKGDGSGPSLEVRGNSWATTFGVFRTEKMDKHIVLYAQFVPSDRLSELGIRNLPALGTRAGILRVIDLDRAQTVSKELYKAARKIGRDIAHYNHFKFVEDRIFGVAQ